MNNELRVGVIIKTHGIRGEVKVYPTTDSPQRFSEIDEVILRQGKTVKYLKIEKVSYFKNLVILKFKGIDNINDIEPFIRAELFVSRDNAAELEEDEYYIGDLIGIRVIEDNGHELGTLKDVLETGANDVYIVEKTDGGELLIPAIRECVLAVDLENETMTVHMLDGLADL